VTGAVAGATLGLVGAGGALVAVTGSPPMRRIRLTQRLAPYLRDAPRRSRLLEDPLHPTLLPGLLPLLAPVLVALARRLDVLVGVRRRYGAGSTAAATG